MFLTTFNHLHKSIFHLHISTLKHPHLLLFFFFHHHHLPEKSCLVRFNLCLLDFKVLQPHRHLLLQGQELHLSAWVAEAPRGSSLQAAVSSPEECLSCCPAGNTHICEGC